MNAMGRGIAYVHIYETECRIFTGGVGVLFPLKLLRGDAWLNQPEDGPRIASAHSDSMIPIGRGQRELLIGDRQTGKSSVANPFS